MSIIYYSDKRNLIKFSNILKFKGVSAVKICEVRNMFSFFDFVLNNSHLFLVMLKHFVMDLYFILKHIKRRGIKNIRVLAKGFGNGRLVSFLKYLYFKRINSVVYYQLFI